VKLKEMVEVASVKGGNLMRMIAGSGLQKTNLMEYSEFLQVVKETKVFILANTITEETEIPYQEDAHSESFDSPFDYVYLEREPIFYNASYQFSPLIGIRQGDSPDSFISIKSFIYDDLKSVFYCYITMQVKSGVGLGCVVKVLQTDELYNECCMVLKTCLQQINSQRIGVESTSEKIRIKRSAGYFTHEINQIIHVKNKYKYKKDSVCIGEKNPINFSHRFFRRGHWRVTDNPMTLGKDRQGERNQYGRTWVMESTVGDESLPLIDNKIRVVKNVTHKND
jgi:hypothetical protein